MSDKINDPNNPTSGEKKVSLPKNNPTNSSAPEANLSPSEQAVNFINKTVLKPDAAPMGGTSQLIADQAAGMMVQDMRSFIQGTQQILTIAIAKAAKEVVNPETTAEGTAAITALNTLMTDLSTYASSIGTTASGIVADFKEPQKKN